MLLILLHAAIIGFEATLHLPADQRLALRIWTSSSETWLKRQDWQFLIYAELDYHFKLSTNVAAVFFGCW